ncbi:MAG: hypothetical protein RLZZ623_3235, partial [Actinomycetota bacterium]
MPIPLIDWRGKVVGFRHPDHQITLLTTDGLETMTLGTTETFRCALVGADSLLIECGELLRSRGHEIVAVAAGSAKVAEWARSHGLPVVVVDDGADNSAWVAALAQHQFEWLFAITHLAILPDSVLALPTAGAVNFHDGPLPNYAGLNAPAWALLNGEPTYGISWHEITSGIDEGDLFKQELFEVATSETSLSLNTRNFEVAIDSFGVLVDEIAAGRVVRTPQDLSSPRVTYRRSDRPEALCMLDWRRPAVELDRLVRALDFGPYANPLGSPTIAAGDVVFVVKRVELRSDGGAGDEGEPGEVLDVDGELVIATGDGSIALQVLETRFGAAVSIADAIAAMGVQVGTVLPLLDDASAANLTELGRKFARNERFFTSRLANLAPVELPWASTPPVDHVAEYNSVAVRVPLALSDGARGPADLLAAFGVTLARLSGTSSFHVALIDSAEPSSIEATRLVSAQVPLAFQLDLDSGFTAAASATNHELSMLRDRGGFLVDLVGREPELRRVPELAAGRIAPIAARIEAAGGSSVALPGAGVVLELTIGQACFVRYDTALVAAADARRFVDCLEAVMASVAADAEAPIATVDLLGPSAREQILGRWNDTSVDYDHEACIHHLFEAQVDRAPDATALVFEGTSITYRALDQRANQVAAHLRTLGVGPDAMVGVHVERGIELMVAVLGVHKAGAGYVPLDPTYPSDRLEHMIRDSGCPVIITLGRLEASLPLPTGSTAAVVRLDTDAATFDRLSTERVRASTVSSQLAYCIYTSGSTGLPKGVLIEHRNAVNFFVGMDAVVAHDLPATWFAVTSLSFDISVLELLYTITRGFSVVIYLDHDKRSGGSEAAAGEFAHRATPIDFSLFYFSGDEAENTGAGKYRLLLEGARWADEHGFCAVWTPERHFHAFGGLYPQPAVTGAAVAAITKRVQIRAGSVVMPLHHPIRVAEAWSIVDNISDGRVGVSIAS